MAMITACSGATKKQVKDFALKVGSNLEAGRLDSVKAAYPAIDDADSIAFTLIPDSIVVTDGDADTLYNVSFGGGVNAVVAVADDGAMSVVSTSGLFAYPASSLDFARRVGALKNPVTDAQLAQIMTNVEDLAAGLYGDYKKQRAGAIRNLGFTSTREMRFNMEGGEGYYTLKNTSDKPIKGSEYTIQVRSSSLYPGMMNPQTKYSSRPGQDLAPGASTRIKVYYNMHFHETVTGVKMKDLSAAEFMAVYTPSGNEYAEYMKSHSDAGSATGAKLSDGPYNISGKLGGKYPIHLVINAGMRDGYYYYDKNGSSNKLTLTVKSFSRKSGKIVLEERNAAGDITGSFTGTLTPSTFTGEMTAFTGKSYNFNLKVD